MDENEETDVVGRLIFDQKPPADNFSDAAMSEAMSPGFKRLRDLEAGSMTHLVETSAANPHFKTLQRPISSGEEANGVSQFHMPAANLRSANVKRPDAVQRPSAALQALRPSSPKDQVMSRPKTPSHTK